jgi:hypothetical protein
MLRPGGYAVIVDPSLPKPIEQDTFTCSHCSKIVFVKATPNLPKPDIGGFCRLCMKNVCGTCADKGNCDPFEKKLERMEQRDRFRKSIG